MIRGAISLIAAIGLLATVSGSVSAGGVATVHLDQAPTGVTVGVPVSIGFMVMQHDITAVNVDRAFVTAANRANGDTLDADAIQTGAVGHYVVELTFPSAGSWKWSIIPIPFAGTSFESIIVSEAGTTPVTDASSDGLAHPVSIRTGSCDAPGEEQFRLSDVVPGQPMLDSQPAKASGVVGTGAEPVAISATTVAVTIGELTSEPHAILVYKDADDADLLVACGQISGAMWNGALIVGLAELNNSGDVGVATLSEKAGQTIVSLYMLTVPDPTSALSTGKTAEVKIVGASGDWHFSPASLTISSGTTVIWQNTTEMAHTVTGHDLAFEDSGPFGPGETYEQLFTTPGTYLYFCSPHPFMTGQIIVT